MVSPRQPSLLGLSMRICDPASSLDAVWHILEVLEGSPAESAGLVPWGDWIVGWSGGVLKGENDFLDVVEAVSILFLSTYHRGTLNWTLYIARRQTIEGVCLFIRFRVRYYQIA